VLTEETCSRIAAPQAGRCRAWAARVAFLFAFVALTTAGADARQVAAVSGKERAVAHAREVPGNTARPARAAQQGPAYQRLDNDFSLSSAGAEQELKSELAKHIGTRYKRGGTGRGGFDCSGFVRSMYQKLFGVDLPHNAHSQFHLSGFERLDKDSLQPGDLVFFAATVKKKRISHVGIYLDEGQFIHAQSKREVIISNIDDRYWRSRLVSGRRLENKQRQVVSPFDAWPNSTPPAGDASAEEPSDLLLNCLRAQHNGGAPPLSLLAQSTGLGQHCISLTYVRPVFGAYGNLQIGSFRKQFDLYGNDATAALRTSDPYESYTAYSYSQGIRVAGDIKPCAWMRITPSLMYYDYGHELASFERPERAIGLDVNMGSADAGWSLSTGLRYTSLRSADLNSARMNDPYLLDLTLTCAHRLSDRIQLAFMGQRLYNTLSERTSRAGSNLGLDQRLFFMLNLNY